MIEHRLRGADEAPSGRAPGLRHANVENLTIVLHVGVVSVNSVLTGEVVNDILPDQRGVVRQFQAPGLVLKVGEKNCFRSKRKRKGRGRQTLNWGIGLLDLGCCGKVQTMERRRARDRIRQVRRIMIRKRSRRGESSCSSL